jgi:hypothetical protein
MRTVKILVILCILFVYAGPASTQIVQPMRYDHYSFTQNANVGVGVARTTHPSAYFEIGNATGGNKGFLPPRLTTTERDAISTPATGLFVYNRTLNRYQGYNGSAWVTINIDTTAQFLTSVYRRAGTDSVFYVKGGIHTFSFKDSLGLSSIPNLQQAYDAGSSYTVESWISDSRRSIHEIARSLGLRYRDENKQTVTLANAESLIHHFVTIRDTLFGITRSVPNVLIRFNNLDDLTNYDTIQFSGYGDCSGGMSMVYAPSTGKLYTNLMPNDCLSNVIVEIDPTTLAWTVKHSRGTTGWLYQDLETDDSYLYTVVADDNMRDSIIKISLSSWTATSAHITSNSTSGYIHALGLDGTNIYATELGMNPGKIYKIRPSDLSTLLSASFTSGDQSPTDDPAFSGDYVWVGLETASGYVLKILKSDLTITRVNTGTASASYGVFFDAGYIWNLHATSPGVLTRIDPGTNEIWKHTLPSGENNPNELIKADGQRYFLSLYTTPTKVTRFAVPAMTYVSGGSSGSGEANTASNLGGGLDNYSTKSGVDLRFNSFNSTDFDLASNLISIDATLKSNWNTAFGWGNHAGLYFLLSDTAAKTWDWADITGAPAFITTRDRFGLSGEDVTATSARAFELGGNNFSINNSATFMEFKVRPNIFGYTSEHTASGSYRVIDFSLNSQNRFGYVQLTAGNRISFMGVDSLGFTAFGWDLGTLHQSFIKAYPDKIIAQPYDGIIEIDSLKLATSMTNKWITVWDDATLKFERISPDSIGGSGPGATPDLQAVTDEGATTTNNITVPTEAYDATGWDGDFTIPTKDAIRDKIESMSGGVSDHGALTGLSDDDHTIYALLAGRTGGQTIKGGTDAADKLILQSTSGNGSGSALAIEFKGGNNGATSYGGFRHDGILQLAQDYIYMPSGSGTEIFQNSSNLYIQVNGGATIFRNGGTYGGRIDAGQWMIGDWSGAANSDLQLVGSFARTVTSTATGVTLGVNHSNVIVTATGQTIVLPAISGITGREYYVKLTASGTCTIDANSTETIDGSTTFTLTAQNNSVKLVAGASEWHVVSDYQATAPTITEGTYTPTLTNTTNIAASTAYVTQYIQVGDRIHVFGEVDIDATATGAVELRLDVPITSAFTQTYEVAGTAVCSSSGVPAAVSCNVASGLVTIKYIATTTTNDKYSFHFSYKYNAP